MLSRLTICQPSGVDSFCPISPPAFLHAVAQQSLQLLAAATLAALGAAFWAPSWRPASLAALLHSMHSGLLCMLCWVAGQSVLDIVFSQPCCIPTSEDPGSLEPLLRAIADSNPLVQVRQGSA